MSDDEDDVLPWWYPLPVDVTAYHEASHAVAAVKFGIAFINVEILAHQHFVPRGDNLGGLHLVQDIDKMLEVAGPANAPDRQQLKNLAIVALAGEAGQAVFENRECDIRLPSASGDYGMVEKVAKRLYSDTADREAFIEEQTAAARELVSDPTCEDQIRLVASRLKIAYDLSYDNIAALMKRSLELSDNDD
jgi:hypothetical protein